MSTSLGSLGPSALVFREPPRLIQPGSHAVPGCWMEWLAAAPPRALDKVAVSGLYQRSRPGLDGDIRARSVSAILRFARHFDVRVLSLLRDHLSPDATRFWVEVEGVCVLPEASVSPSLAASVASLIGLDFPRAMEECQGLCVISLACSRGWLTASHPGVASYLSRAGSAGYAGICASLCLRGIPSSVLVAVSDRVAAISVGEEPGFDDLFRSRRALHPGYSSAPLFEMPYSPFMGSSDVFDTLLAFLSRPGISAGSDGWEAVSGMLEASGSWASLRLPLVADIWLRNTSSVSLPSLVRWLLTPDALPVYCVDLIPLVVRALPDDDLCSLADALVPHLASSSGVMRALALESCFRLRRMGVAIPPVRSLALSAELV